MSVQRRSSLRRRAVAAAVGVLVLGGGCSHTPPSANASSVAGNPGQTSAGERTGAPTVELSPNQLKAITIAPVGTAMFALQKDAVGNIGFGEDLGIVQAEATLLGAAATYELTTKELARASGLTAAGGGVSEREVEQATSDQETAAGALEAARDAVRALGKTDAEIARILASRTLDSAARAGSDPRPGSKWAFAEVTETDVPLFRVGQPVQVTVPAYPDRAFAGVVSRIYAVVDPDIHRAKVHVLVSDPGDALRPGMLASFVIRVRPPVEATAIPTTGVVREGDGSMIAWVTTDRRHFVERTLRLGLEQDGRDEVLEGLRPGELVVTEGAVFLSSVLHAMPVE